MADPTDEDRQRASELYWNMPTADVDQCIELIAQALAEERERARG